jgi:hypothetical protein
VISNDGRGGEVSQTIVCIVIDVNEKPVIADGNNTSLMFSIQIRSYRESSGKVEITDEDVGKYIYV